MSHPKVPHPHELLTAPTRLIPKVNDWVTEHLVMSLGSITGMWLSFAVPLMAFEVPWLLKVIGLISSYWVQLWALFVLQRSANRNAAKDDAKASADHQALTHIAATVDKILGNQGETS